MSKLLNRSLKKFILYAALVLVASIPVYYLAIGMLWQYEMDEHNIILTPDAAREDKFLLIGAVTLLTVLFFVLLFGGLILLNRRISKRLWQPFYDSLHAIRHFDLNKHQTVDFAETNIEEFKELNESLQKLITGSIAAYNQQKEFANNASHELQTPLAIVQSKLDLLLQSQALTDEQYAIIEEAITALARVNRINKNLLLLAKIENSQFTDKETIDFGELLRNMLAPLTHFSNNKQIDLTTHIHSGVTVEGNRILVEILLNNLLTNAIRHSPSKSTVSVHLDTHTITIKNSGTAALNTEQLFRRFATASPHSPGTGLGLALVKEISNRYRWNIKYTFNNHQHIFSLHF